MEICCHSVAIYDENVMSEQMIRKWCQQFKAELESIDDEIYAECLVEVHTDENRH